MPHPNSYTEEVAAQIVGYITGGLYITAACELAGISRQTYYNWQRRGQKGEAPYDDFLKRVREAEAKAEARLSTHIEKMAADDWRAAAWKLERRFPDKYGVRSTTKVEVSRSIEKLLDAVQEHMSEGAYDELVGALAALQGLDASEEDEG